MDSFCRHAQTNDVHSLFHSFSSFFCSSYRNTVLVQYICVKRLAVKILKCRKFIFHMHKSRHFNSLLKRDDGTLNTTFYLLNFHECATTGCVCVVVCGYIRWKHAYYYENGKILKENANYSMNINFFHVRELRAKKHHSE